MKFVPHPGVTRRFGPPADWSEAEHGECGSLEIADVEREGGLRFMESLWRPSEEELAALNRGAAFILGISGADHPVVYVGVTVPPRRDGVETR